MSFLLPVDKVETSCESSKFCLSSFAFFFKENTCFVSGGSSRYELYIMYLHMQLLVSAFICPCFRVDIWNCMLPLSFLMLDTCSFALSYVSPYPNLMLGITYSRTLEWHLNGLYIYISFLCWNHQSGKSVKKTAWDSSFPAVRALSFAFQWLVGLFHQIPQTNQPMFEYSVKSCEICYNPWGFCGASLAPLVGKYIIPGSFPISQGHNSWDVRTHFPASTARRLERRPGYADCADKIK